MLTHTITVVKPPVYNNHKINKKSEYRRRKALRQDLDITTCKAGDVVELGNKEYGQVVEVIDEYDNVLEWNGFRPLNILVMAYDDYEEYFYNIKDLIVL